MLLFLKVVAGVVIGLAVFALLAWWLFKRWLRGKVGQFARVAALLDGADASPVRVHLQLAEHFEPEDDFLQQWDIAYGLGFRALADLQTVEGEPQGLRAAVHAPALIGLCLCQHDNVVHYRLFALAEGQNLQVRSDGPGEDFTRGGLHWRVEPGLALEAAFESLRLDCPSDSLRELDLALLRRVFERSHAQREDALLARAPELARIRERARQAGLSPTDAELQQALSIERSQWHDRIREAVLDQYMQAGRIEARKWLQLQPRLHVVHAGMQAEDVRELLVESDADGVLFEQAKARPAGVFALYESVAQRLPAARQRRLIRELRLPVEARIYAPIDNPAKAQAAARVFVVSGQDEQGQSRAGGILARDGGEARLGAYRSDLKQTRLLLESIPLAEFDADTLDPEGAAATVRSLQQPVWRSVLEALRAHVWLWGIPLALAAWNLSQGRPYGWGDYLSFLLLALALSSMLLLIGPMLIYNEYQRARALRRQKVASASLWWLARLNVFGLLKHHQLELERCKLLADRGESAQALNRWDALAPRLTPEEHLSGRAQILSCGEDIEAALEAHRVLVAASSMDIYRVDLALALSKHAEYAEEAAGLLAQVDPDAQTELVAGGHAFARGLLAQHAGRDDLALPLLSSVMERWAPYQSSPLLAEAIGEVHGWTAVSLRRSGRVAEAEALWRSAAPIIEAHPSLAPLRRRYAEEA
jgi:hypothetical protein